MQLTEKFHLRCLSYSFTLFQKISLLTLVHDRWQLQYLHYFNNVSLLL